MTDFIILPRAGGKTTKLVQLMVDDPELTYIAPTVSQAIGVAARHYALITGQKPDHRRFLSVNQFREQARHGGRVVIDEVDGVLEYLLGSRVVAVAGTGASV